MNPSPGKTITLSLEQAHWLRGSLLDWYGSHRRDLPWRRVQDPYAIWISEAMLQQTRVATVIEYWNRFLGQLPTVHDLASADEELVLSLWSGLGYYSRARSLHRAAKQIVSEHGGEFPRTRAQALALPGVGEYTAGAVLSIAYGNREALVDGNVERVLARVLGLPGVAGSGPLRKAVWEWARWLLPDSGFGDWNQALMELGATVCPARNPQCEACPWSTRCEAKSQGHPESIPARKPRRTPVELSVESLFISEGERFLLTQRPAKGAMRGMWELPTRVAKNQPKVALWTPTWPGDLTPTLGAELLRTKHAITHHKIEVRVHAAAVESQGGGAYRWVRQTELASLPLTGIALKSFAQLSPAAGSAPGKPPPAAPPSGKRPAGETGQEDEGGEKPAAG